MSAVAPAAIYSLWNNVHGKIPRAVLSGIVGDVAHSFGYHLARRDLSSGDYSVTLAKDRLGSSANASALDISLPPDLMKIITTRLLNAAKANDPRLAALREFCGTTNGTITHPYDLSDHQDGPLGSWDASHLWHIHLSFYREYADNYAALAPIADVLAGIPPQVSIEEEIMSYYKDKAAFEAALLHAAQTAVAGVLQSTDRHGHGIPAWFQAYLFGSPLYNDPVGSASHPKVNLIDLAARVDAIAKKVGA